MRLEGYDTSSALEFVQNLLIKIGIKKRSKKDKLDKRKCSQFFQSLRNFSNQAKVRSTTQRLGITENLWTSFLLTISTFEPIIL